MTLTLPPTQTITTLHTDAETTALYQHIEDILCCIAGAAVAHEDGNDARVREHHREAMDRCWLLMASLGTRGTEKGQCR
jgi:hypothetical protein